MKKIVFTVMMLVGITGFTRLQAANPVMNRDVHVNFTSLTKYLQLSPEQQSEVYEINEFFKHEMQSMEVRPEKALSNNLKLMRKVLTEKQYRSYLSALNATVNNLAQRQNLQDKNCDYLASK